VRLVFVHGWALGPEMWDVLAPRLSGWEQLRVDLGFFGAPALPELREGDILIGHSAGLFWGLRQFSGWGGVVAINSFARFTLDESGRGCVRLAALRAMQKSLARDAMACVAAFRASIGAPPCDRPAQAGALAEGLALLENFDAGPVLAANRALVLGAEDDALAPVSAARDLAAQGAALVLRPEGGHGLPWTAPEFCAEQIADFLNERHV
jgi:pimeloyl-[acyl-carrier protein] methyl ester esterase